MALFDSGTLVANVALSDTFNTWRIRTNQINTQAAGLASNNTFTGTLNTFNNAAAFKGAVTAPVVTANSLAGTVSTAAQPNITSVGTLTTLSVTGTAGFSGPVTAPLVTANSLAGTIATAAQPNITSVGTLASLATNGLLTAPTVQANDLFGTLGTGTQTNITSVGTLLSLASSGPITAPIVTANAINSFGPITAPIVTANVINSLSDVRYKENIQSLSQSLLVVNQLKGRSFNWKDTDKKSFGVIAQEIEEILPDVVFTNSNGIKSVNYTAIIAFLIESIKELEQRIENIEGLG